MGTPKRLIIMEKYTKEELETMLHKEVEIILSDDEDTFSFKGKMVSYNLEGEDSEAGGEFCFYTDHGAVKTIGFSNLKEIRELSGL